jgi:CTP:molybdopterin cytidylyltransferase MocA
MNNHTRICAVVPAAGRGVRLNSSCPKIFTEIGGGLLVYDVLISLFLSRVDHVCLVLSPEGKRFYQNLPPAKRSPAVSVAVQTEPVGMGDAVFCAYPEWKNFDNIFVIWGDQAGISPATAETSLRSHCLADGPRMTLPLVRSASPYVEYILSGSRLLEVRQTREGDVCSPGGLSDIGVFVLSTQGLYDEWGRYLRTAIVGAKTGEVNFLPFLPFLSLSGWPVTVVEMPDSGEARGINTPDDLAFFRSHIFHQENSQ